ncbi:hypothetical protein Tco_0036991 [Tanacetum coccineum]
MPYDSPLPGGNTPGIAEGSMKLNELMNLYTKLVERVTTLETELTKIKQVYGKALTKLVKKVKSLEDKLKSTRGRIEEQEVKGVQEEEQEVEYHFETIL